MTRGQLRRALLQIGIGVEYHVTESEFYARMKGNPCPESTAEIRGWSATQSKALRKRARALLVPRRNQRVVVKLRAHVRDVYCDKDTTEYTVRVCVLDSGRDLRIESGGRREASIVLDLPGDAVTEILP